METSIVKCDSYDFDKVKNAMKLSVELIGGFSKYIKPSDSVLLKPNLLGAKRPEEVVTTNPVFVEALIILLKEYGIRKIALGDSPSFEPYRHVLKRTGMMDVCNKHDVKIIEFKKQRAVFDKRNRTVKRFLIAKELGSFDKIINLPKMKTHSLTVFTGAVKNLFGCIPGTLKIGYHVKLRSPYDFTDMLVDLCNVVVPDLNIMDGIVGMEGNGPNAGNPRKFGVIISGESAVALDVVALQILSLQNVPLLKVLKDRNLMPTLDIKGQAVDSVKVETIKAPRTSITTKIPEGIFKLFRNYLFSYPYVNKTKCTSCEMCAKMCPVNAITMKKKYPSFDYFKCIRCYCCNEVCPAKAINLKKPWLKRLMDIFIRI